MSIINISFAKGRMIHLYTIFVHNVVTHKYGHKYYRFLCCAHEYEYEEIGMSFESMRLYNCM